VGGSSTGNDEILCQLGYQVIRFTNAQVLQNIDQVILEIQYELEGTPSPILGSGKIGEGDGG
jgi:very-short-patch-repair endonuclease